MEDIDVSKSTLLLLAYQGIKAWEWDKLLDLLSDEDAIVRTLAAQQLQIIGGDEIFEAVVELISSGTPYVRESAAFVLGQLGTPNRPFKEKSLLLLLDMITDESECVRAAAVAALGHLYVEDEKIPNAVTDSILELASDDSSDVRSCVAFALGHSENRRVVKETLELLKNDSIEEVRGFAEFGIDLLNEDA